MKVCIIVPVYNHQGAIAAVVENLKPLGYHCFLINDGSSPECSEVLSNIAIQNSTWITLYQRELNGGKGAAVIDGFNLAITAGYSHAIQVDSDGQHKLDDIKVFVQAAEKYPQRMILGQPEFDESVPKKRLYGRYITNIWIWINTLSMNIADGMCGFRCYPLNAVEQLLKTNKLGLRMDFDIDIAVRLYWQGVKTNNIKTQVKYPIDGVSHFKMLQDNLLISRKHAQLFFGMLWRFPKLLTRHIL